jgi:flagellar hook assembly protein FlgD
MEINISIYDITGRLIKTLRSGRQIRGMHEIVWDGKNNKGEKISSGIYFCHLMTDEKSLSRKIILLR